jgi:hypothetical protein
MMYEATKDASDLPRETCAICRNLPEPAGTMQPAWTNATIHERMVNARLRCHFYCSRFNKSQACIGSSPAQAHCRQGRDLNRSHEAGQRSSLSKEIQELGPLGLWKANVRALLQNHGFALHPHESFAEPLSRALGMDMSEFTACSAQGRLVSAL